jgi:hypothetical protein
VAAGALVPAGPSPRPGGRRGRGVSGRAQDGRHPAARRPGVAARRTRPAARHRARVLPVRRPSARPGRDGAARAAGRDPLPQLLGRAAGPGRPGRVREPPHLPADRGRPHQAAAGVHPRPLLRRRGHRRGGRARVRRHPARRPGPAPGGRPARPYRGPVRPDPPPGQPGHHHADAPVRRGHRAGVVPAALAGPGQGGPRGRDVPGDPGRRVPAVRRGLLARAGGLLAVAVHAARVRRGAPRDPGRVRGGAGGLRLLAVRPAHGRRAGPGPDPGVVPGPRRRPADLRHRPAHRGGDRQPGVRRAVQPGPAGKRRGQRARGAGVRRARHRPRRDRRSGAGGRRRRAAAGLAAPGHAHRVTSSPRPSG